MFKRKNKKKNCKDQEDPFEISITNPIIVAKSGPPTPAPKRVNPLIQPLRHYQSLREYQSKLNPFTASCPLNEQLGKCICRETNPFVCRAKEHLPVQPPQYLGAIP